MDVVGIVRVYTVVIKQYDQKQPGEKKVDSILSL